MRISAKFLLSSLFAFLPAVGCAQYGLYGDCPFPPRGSYIIEPDNATIVKDLENGQNCLNDGLKELKLDVGNLQSQPRGNDDLKTEILELQDKLAQTKLDLRIDETKIETLQNSYDMLSRLLDRMLNDRLNGSGLAARKPAGPVSKPNAPASKPSPSFIPDTPATAPHPASKKSDASKPKAPVTKPAPAVKEGTVGGPGLK